MAWHELSLQTGHVPIGWQVCDWHAHSSRRSIVHLSREMIAPMDLEPNLSQMAHSVWFISKLTIFIHKHWKGLQLSAQCNIKEREKLMQTAFDTILDLALTRMWVKKRTIMGWIWPHCEIHPAEFNAVAKPTEQSIKESVENPDEIQLVVQDEVELDQATIECCWVSAMFFSSLKHVNKNDTFCFEPQFCQVNGMLSFIWKECSKMNEPWCQQPIFTDDIQETSRIIKKNKCASNRKTGPMALLTNTQKPTVTTFSKLWLSQSQWHQIVSLDS